MTVDAKGSFDRIALIGYRATGKTSVGRVLAERLDWEFIDTDAEVERVAKRSIADIFADEGEEAFRKLEIEAIRANAQRAKCVLSLGGGAVMRQPNRDAIGPAYTVLLTATAESIHQRLTQDSATSEQRPNLTSAGGLAEVRELLAKRAATYKSCADLVVDTEGRTVEQIADVIIQDVPVAK